MDSDRHRSRAVARVTPLMPQVPLPPSPPPRPPRVRDPSRRQSIAERLFSTPIFTSVRSTFQRYERDDIHEYDELILCKRLVHHCYLQNNVHYKVTVVKSYIIHEDRHPFFMLHDLDVHRPCYCNNQAAVGRLFCSYTVIEDTLYVPRSIPFSRLGIN